MEKVIDSFWKRAETPREYLSILIPLSPDVCWWAWVGETMDENLERKFTKQGHQ